VVDEQAKGKKMRGGGGDAHLSWSAQLPAHPSIQVFLSPSYQDRGPCVIFRSNLCGPYCAFLAFIPTHTIPPSHLFLFGDNYGQTIGIVSTAEWLN